MSRPPSRKRATKETRYLVWNETDQVYASPGAFASSQAARAFMVEFRKRFRKQGYYLTSGWRRIDPMAVLLVIEPIRGSRRENAPLYLPGLSTLPMRSLPFNSVSSK